MEAGTVEKNHEIVCRGKPKLVGFFAAYTGGAAVKIIPLQSPS